MSLKLTLSNYYSREANELYWSASFVKGMFDCPARTLAELREEHITSDSTALLLGNYVDAHFEGTLEQYKAEHPELFKRDGTLKAEYLRASEMIARAENDPVFMEYMHGDKQVIKTGVIDGIPFKSRFDVLKTGKRIVDLKTVKDMRPIYKQEEGLVSFADYWKWPLQMAIYQAIEGNNLPCYLAVITKENPPDIAIIEVPQHVLDTEMKVLRENLPYFDAMRRGLIDPERCEKCAYCRKTHKLHGPVSLDDFMTF